MSNLKNPILFASDFDGTFYFERSTHPFFNRDLSAIRQFQKKGHLFGVCTGRSLDGVQVTSSKLPDFDFWILSSGALILDKNRKKLYEKNLTFDTVVKIWKQFREEAAFLFMADKQAYVLSKEVFPVIGIQDITELSKIPLCSMSLTASNELEAEKITAIINTIYSSTVTAFQNVNHIDISPKGCSKGNAISFLKNHFGLMTCCGIGDSYNDIPLLESVEHAFTFYHSPAKVKEKAETLVTNLSEALFCALSFT
ncbi:HAD family hydrolase [Parablautia sp. Marseille-Q6255]|uniref:HAD family hydrolase n=1 Tax=Parablautia sp. Marseille-Q6255 TaxID=3039593 RepID=UPI0024BD58D7|nr:HAD family hydrolase [Parablautia sp. Marseille-Q6255]